MKKFCVFEIHEYMDLKPSTTIRAMEENDARSFAKRMNENYSGGTTKFVKVMTTKEATEHVKSVIAGEVKAWQSDSIEFIGDIINLFKECYKTDFKTFKQ